MEWLTNFFKGFWKVIKKFFWWLIDSVFAPFRWAMDGFFAVISSIFYLMFDGFLTAVVAVFNTLDLSASFFSQTADWAGLPSQLTWLITQLGLPQCLSMMALALGIRVLLNVLPAAVTRI